MKIKICGLKDPENIKAVSALGPNYMGFIFYGRSPRFVNKDSLESLKNIPDSIFKTAVFVNETAERINKLIDQHNFDTIQLHGDETAEFCNLFKNKVTVIKAFGLNNDFNFEQLTAYKNKVDFFLFDTKTEIHGGSGKMFDWSILNKYNLDVPFFLSGGLSLDNMEEIRNINHPQFYGVDLNSKFETEPGIKNIEKLEKAFDIIKQNISNELRG
ncbi:MAG TPA: phosphoribosylanthranilate isomerase [Mucilaginibacter sp.]|jgi:phosphoribosylanthranilate isomerase